MKFNYTREKRKFDARWKRLQEEYKAAGMDRLAIEELRAFDWECFCSQRVYCKHQLMLPDLRDGDCAVLLALTKKYPALQISFDEMDFSGRYAWINTVEDDRLRERLWALGARDLEILTMLVMDGSNRTEIAKCFGVSCSAITQRIQRIRKKLKNG